MGERTLVLCGEPARGDDDAAFRAADLLDPALLAGVRVIPAGSLDVQLLLDLPAEAETVIVDAVAGIPPGTLWIRPLAELAGMGTARAAGPGPRPRSSHELPLEETIALAALIGGRVPAGSFVGIGGRSFGMGDPLSPEVEGALRDAAAAIAAALTRSTEG